MTAPVAAARVASAPSASAPVGTASAAASNPGATARTQQQLRARSSTRSPSTRPARSTGKPAGRSRTILAPTHPTNKTTRRALRGQRLLLVEFMVCTLILALSPLTDKHKTDTPGRWIQRATGVCGLFVILALIGGAGPKAAKVSAGLGGLVTVVLMVSDRDVFVRIAGRLGAPPPAGPAGPGSVIAQGIDVPTLTASQPGIPDSGTPPALPGTAARPGRGGYRGFAV